MIKVRATNNDAGRTIYKFLIKFLDNLPVSKIEKIFRKKDLKINGSREVEKKYILNENDEIVIYGISNARKSSKEVKNISIDFAVIYEDENILIVNKKENQAVHSENNSLDEQVLKYLKFEKTDSFIPSSIGRLDKTTSGIMVYAKNYSTLREMKNQQANFEKIYTFKNSMPEKEITVEYYFLKDEANQKVMVHPKFGKKGKTRFFFENKKKYAQIYTGRKHQIRASLSKLGFPIDGDRKYGGKRATRVYLHATRIKFAGLKKELDYLNDQEFISLPKW
ncbi:RluA family pseudouridine synthase [Mycoplasma iguanae]|uniref:RNA pseudouridylate synthase n=2 Tax=Mycoplasma iguanae TaxID=292461 RepID=A0ABY5RBL8_9MOLU|nr:RluA family pseudouridine synthase [Mycoplasma iguanae]